MAKIGHLEQVGAENVFVAGEFIGASTFAAFKAGEARVEMTPAEGPAPTPDPAADPSRNDADPTTPAAAPHDEESG
jgi:hypothetical protein